MKKMLLIFVSSFIVVSLFVYFITYGKSYIPSDNFLKMLQNIEPYLIESPYSAITKLNEMLEDVKIPTLNVDYSGGVIEALKAILNAFINLLNIVIQLIKYIVLAISLVVYIFAYFISFITSAFKLLQDYSKELPSEWASVLACAFTC